MILWSPVWIVALVLAVSAPWLVGAFADLAQYRVRRRTQALVARAAAAAQSSRVGPSFARGTEPSQEERAGGKG